MKMNVRHSPGKHVIWSDSPRRSRVPVFSAGWDQWQGEPATWAHIQILPHDNSEGTCDLKFSDNIIVNEDVLLWTSLEPEVKGPLWSLCLVCLF